MATKTAPAESDMIVDQEMEDVGQPETITAADLGGELDLNSLLAEFGGKPADEGDEVITTTEEDAVEPEADDETAEEESAATTEEEDPNAVMGKRLLDDFFESDKGASETVATLFRTMSQDAQREFLTSLAADVPQSPEFELESDFERALAPVYGDIKTLPAFKADTQKAFTQHAEHINRANVGVAVLESVMEALAEQAGVKLPPRDYDAYLKNSGKGYQEAIKPFKDALQKAVKGVKQEKKERPAGTRSTSAGHVTISAKDSLYDMVKKVQQQRGIL